ncbi:MAG TPA: MFS transporter [Ktedonobacteraceae bacterium]|nr:MFS transporter [Ktedonobacteraceae bacterium]
MSSINEEPIGSTESFETEMGDPVREERENPSLSMPASKEQKGDVLSFQADPRRWIALVIILSGSFMAGMDGFIVNIAIPSIQKGLDASFASMQFVVAGYSLTYAMLLITGGRLGDLYGRKRLFMVGLTGFVFASGLGGLAPNIAILVVARLLQGAAAGLLFPQILALIQVTFREKERDLAFGWYGVTIGLSQAGGLVLGSLLLAANLFGLVWRPLFLINLPIGIVALVLAGPFVPEARVPSTQKLDLGGASLVTLGLAFLIFPLIQGREMNWPWWIFLCLGLAVLLLIGFFYYERFIDARGGSPLLNQSLFQNLPFIRGLLMVILFFGAPGAFLLIVTFYLQLGLGLSAFFAGLITLPFALGVFLASFVAAPIKSKLGKHVLTTGALVMIVGILVCMVTIAWINSASGGAGLLPGLFLIGFGFGLVLSPLVNILLSSIALAHAGAASGMIGTCIQIGLSLGVALIGIVFFGLLAKQMTYATAFTWSLASILVPLVLTIGLVFSLPSTRR